MNQQLETPPRRRMSNAEKLAAAELLVLMFASTLMFTTRADVGARLVRRALVTVAFLLMFIIGWGFERFEPGPLILLFAICFLFQYFCHLFRRWREFRRGVPQHSFYLGTSGFAWRFVPEFVSRGRKLERFFDPLFFGTCGLLIMNFAPHLGGWLIVSSCCLFVVENMAWMREVHRQFDVSDGLVSSDVQGETVERFSPPPPQLTPQPGNSGGIPTGLAADISHQIRRQKAARPREASPAESALSTGGQPLPDARRKSPTAAAMWGLLLGGFGLGGYFRSWPDLFFPFALWAGVAGVAATKGKGWLICGPLVCAIYGYIRAVLHNWRRKGETASAPARALSETRLAPTEPLEDDAPAVSGAEARLTRLKELRRKDLISDTEFDAKRQQILAEL